MNIVKKKGNSIKKC